MSIWDTDEKIARIGVCNRMLRRMRDSEQITKPQWALLKDWLFNAESMDELGQIRAEAMKFRRKNAERACG